MIFVSLGKGQGGTEATTKFPLKLEIFGNKEQAFFKMPWFYGWTCILVFGKCSCHCFCGLFSQVGCSRTEMVLIGAGAFLMPQTS